ncbi:DUF2812 domain-containing protein [Virgibacillus sp. FSP13]
MAVERFTFQGYELEKDDPEDVIFSIDYRFLEPEEDDEYFEMFNSAGWTHVCSGYTFHIFKAEKGTKPIYSDAESAKDKMDRIANPMKSVVVCCVGLTIIFLLIMAFTSGVTQNISKWALLLSFALTIPAIMTYTFFY